MTLLRLGIVTIGVCGTGSVVLANGPAVTDLGWAELLKNSPIAVALISAVVLFLGYMAQHDKLLGQRDKLFAEALSELAQAIRNMRPVMAFAVLLLTMAGCGPRYAGRPTEAKNTVSIYRDASGFGADATVGADTEAVIEGLEAEKLADGSMKMKLPRMQYKAAPSQTIGSWVGPMQEYKAQLEATYTGLANVATANWNGFAQAITAAAPIAGPYLDGLAKAKLARAQRPQLVEQLSGLILSGQMDPTAYRELGVDDDLLAAVERLVDAKIAALRPPTTQPVSP